MKVIEEPFEISQTTYYGFTIEHEWVEYEWVVIATYDSNSAFTERIISRTDETPNNLTELDVLEWLWY